MAKVVSIDRYKSKSSTKLPRVADDAVAEYRDLLYLQAGIMEEAASEAEELLREVKMPPFLFKLDKNYADAYLSMSMKDFVTGDECAEIAFRGIVSETEYAVLITFECLDGNNLDVETQLFKSGQDEWFIYNFEISTWERGPGKDFF